MSATLESTAIPEISNEERSVRLTEAGGFWTKHVEANPENAKLTYLVKGSAEGSVATRVTAGKHEFVIDEPAGLAGDDVAASPVEYALGALAACQVVVYRLYAQGLGIVIDDIDIKAEGDLDVRGLFGFDANVRPGFTEVRVSVQISGPETEERYEELRKVVDEHCPVFDLFSQPTPVKVALSVN